MSVLGTLELPHRVHDAQEYPVRAPNGSILVVYGHERGIKFLWRRGQPLYNHLVYEDEVGSADPSDLTKHAIDVPLPSAALHIAFVPLSSQVESRSAASDTNATHPHYDIPSIFAVNAFVAVACADSSVLIVTIPLDPAATRTNGREKKRSIIQDITVRPAEPLHSLRSIARGISMTWTSDLFPENSSVAPSQENVSSKSSTRGGRKAKPIPAPDTSRWTILLATHTAEASGILRIYAIPLKGGILVQEDIHTLRIEHLPAFAQAIAFTPRNYPSKIHTQLLITDTLGFVRLYEAIARRRSDRHNPWLASFHAPMEQTKPASISTLSPQQIPHILDAAWALSGTCIVILHSTGYWGVWDVHGSGIGAPERKLIQGNQLAVNGNMTGAVIVPFALKGFIGHTSSHKASHIRSSGSIDMDTEPKILAPMTPNTRKAKQEKLFSQQQQQQQQQQHHSFRKSTTNLGAVHGGISISRTPEYALTDKSDDSLVLWYGGEVFSIPSLMSYWQKAATRNLSNTQYRETTVFGSNLSPLHGFSTGGEAITSACQLPNSSTMNASVLRHELLIAAEHRLIFVPSAEDATRPDAGLGALFVPLQNKTNPRKDTKPAQMELDLLSRGELDLGGLDRIIDELGTRNNGRLGFRTEPVAPNQRRVGFATDY